MHRPDIDMVLVILEGGGVVMAGEDDATVGPGAIVAAPAGQARGVRATTRLVALHVVSPPPTERDHAEIQRGTWR